MAGFCGKCGRPLQDGEVCNCQGAQPTRQFGGAAPRPNGYQGQAGGYGVQPGGYTPPQNGYYGQPGGYPGGAPNQGGQTMNQTKSAVKEVVPLVKKPFTKTQEIARSGNLAIGIGGIAVEMVMAMLMVLAIRGKFISSIGNMVGHAMGKYYAAEILSAMGLGIGKLLLVTVLLTAGVPALRALLLHVFTQNVFKGQTSFREMLTVEGVKNLFAGAIFLLAAICALISVNASMIVYGIGVAALVGIEPILYAGTARLDNNKKLYVYMIVAVIIAVVVALILGLYAENIRSCTVHAIASGLDGLGDLDDLFDYFY